MTIAIAVIALVPRVSSPISIGFKPTLLDAALVLTFVGWAIHRTRNEDHARQLPISLPLVALIAVVVAVAATVLGGGIATLFTSVNGKL